MAYTLTSAEKAPLIDGEGNPLVTANVTDPAGNHAPFAIGLAASIVDEGGVLVCVGNFPGTLTFQLARDGVVASHDVTVTAAGGVPFDWTLGVPVPK
jgi:hypothetical protein